MILVDALYRSTYPEYLQYIYLVAPVSLMLLNPIGFALCEVQKWRQSGHSQHRTLGIFGVVILQVMRTVNVITAFRSNRTTKVSPLFCPSSAGAEKSGGVHGYGRNSGSLCPRPADSSCSVRVHRRFGQLFWRGSLVLPWPYYGKVSNVTTCAFFLDLILYVNMIHFPYFFHCFGRLASLEN